MQDLIPTITCPTCSDLIERDAVHVCPALIAARIERRTEILRASVRQARTRRARRILGRR